jgi:hypothetical protein
MDALTTTQVLPISGCVAVFAHQPDGRSALELLSPSGLLLAVCSNSTLDSSPLRGGWRGERGTPWALAIGLQTAGSGVAGSGVAGSGVAGSGVTVQFHRRRGASSVQLPAVSLGEFWVAEAAGAFTQVTVRAGVKQSGIRLAPVRTAALS